MEGDIESVSSRVNDSQDSDPEAELSLAIPAPSDEDENEDQNNSGETPRDDVNEGEGLVDICSLNLTDANNGSVAYSRSMPLTRSEDDINCPEVSATPQKKRNQVLKVLKYSVSHDDEQLTRRGWRDTLYEYCQDTSIHGLKKITEPQPFPIRRLVWIVLLLLGVSLFGLQMVKAITYFLSWPVSVNINIRYNDSIRFPAVTLCNQNAFKLTVSRYYEHYELISHLYNQHQDLGHRHSEVNLSAYPDAENHYITDLFMLSAHRRDNFFVGCMWDGEPCEDSDFAVTLTDFGVCYTFNSGVRGGEIKYTTHTGSQAGLQLRLNIEQYEYMKGPNTGAGLKLHVHNQGDVALVKDHGIAVAPGAHAFVGVNIIKIHNLPQPHGECKSDVKLDYYDHYTQATCMMDCLQHFMIDRCGCRDFYMPLANTTFPMCTLKEYLECVLPAYRYFNGRKTSLCPCQIPCDVTIYSPTVSYGSTSNFDMDALLHSDSAKLQSEFVKARDVLQRVHPDIIKKDTMLINNLINIVNQFSEILPVWNYTVAYTRGVSNSVYDHYRSRYNFHMKMGLQQMRYVIRHEFVRGWEVVEERGVRFVASNFYDVIDSFDRFLQFANRSSPACLEAAWFSVENVLLGRRELAQKAIHNVSKAYDAFMDGRRIVDFKASISPRYDKSFASMVSILLDGNFFAEAAGYRDGMVKHLHGFIDSLETLVDMGKRVSNGSALDTDSLQKCKTQFIVDAKGYNYQLFKFSDRIVHGSLNRVDKDIDEFETVWKDLEKAANDLLITVVDTEAMLTNSQSFWHGLQAVAARAGNYLTNNATELKTTMATAVMPELSFYSDLVQIFLRNLRSNARTQIEKWYRLEKAVKVFWEKILANRSLREFYRIVEEDFQSYLKANETEMKMKYTRIFFSMLRNMDKGMMLQRFITPENILDLSGDELGVLLNADVFSLDFSTTMNYTHNTFARYAVRSDFVASLGTRDELLLKIVGEFMQDMKEYLEENKIDTNFYRENFLRVDVYLEDLSYEEIIQQEAYDLQQLLSDIGGSIGLFIGASALSVFEFLDVIMLHSWTRR